jgi:hypothetical protein
MKKIVRAFFDIPLFVILIIILLVATVCADLAVYADKPVEPFPCPPPHTPPGPPGEIPPGPPVCPPLYDLYIPLVMK